MTRNRATDHARVMEYVTPLGKQKPGKKPPKVKNPPIDKAAYIEWRIEKGLSIYSDDGIYHGAGSDIHHCLIGRMKGYPVLDDYRNYAWVEHNMHIAKKYDTLFWRKYFWRMNCRRFGEKAMLEWIDAVLAAGLDKSRIDWL